MTATLPRAARQARAIVLAVGVVYLVLAIAGFVYVGTDTFGYEEPIRLLGVLGVSTLANIVHTFVGLVATISALRGGASAFAVVAMVAFTAATAFGIVSLVFADTGDPWNQTWGNVVLYALTALACGYIFSLWMRGRDLSREKS